MAKECRSIHEPLISTLTERHDYGIIAVPHYDSHPRLI